MESTGYEWVDPPREPIRFFSLYPIRQRVMVYVRRYDHGEHCAMLSMIFSPRNSGSRMIKRLAEINLVNGDDEAALKYLRILDKTLLHKSWAEKRIPVSKPRE